MRHLWHLVFILSLAFCTPLLAQMSKLRVIAIGAHPDDCEDKFAGTAVKLVKAGHAVKFLSLANGDAGHQGEGGGALARRRHAETQESARRLGISEYEVLDNHDGELLPTLDVRKQIIRAIRQWNADIVLAPRPNDYHPDHRYASMLVQDAAYLVMVPNIVPDVLSLRKNPVFLYYQDEFQKPAPFHPDVVVAIDDVWNTKIDALDAHVSQVYEWLPWIDGNLEKVPKDAAARKKWLAAICNDSGDCTDRITPAVREALVQRYGAQAEQFTHAEAFELCEYGRRPSIEELRQMFPK
jgi:LmbE family N-acetylglucosaminyl deacetylase